MADLQLWHYFLLAGLGIVAGTLNVLAGGGSLLTLPVMVFLGMDGPVANGTNRVAIFAQNLAAVGGFKARGFSDFRLSLTLALAALPGAIAGAWVGTLVRGELFNRLLGAILIAVLVWMAIERHQKQKLRTATKAASTAPEKSVGGTSEMTPELAVISRGRLVFGHLCLVAVGFYGGFIQAGVGFLLMAALHQGMGLDLVRVNMHKVFVVGVYTLAALIVFAARGQVWWIPGLALAVGNSLGGWIGSQISVKKGEKWIRIVLYVTLVAMALKLIL
ncbi:MAG: sulfite exporter TauE/SafE family protein [Verrucomicrobiae bacterium]|nr:sulfite exporter TauE/SafE family protein [Verrucomicrobiae bacterium]